ncbi:MAG: germination protein YpeB [Ruminococcaceae bacterium]|nr:germination protein YpeB [Oscillospiraceae bacterium]
MTMTKRCFVRIISFSIALILAFALMALEQRGKATSSQLRMQNTYMRAVEDLSLSLDNIKTTLNKGLYTNSPAMMNQLSGKLWSEAANAKAALSQLPMEELKLEQTYKFLSQVGNYSQSLSKKFGQGETLTEEEKKNLKTLYGYAEDLSGKMWQVEKKIEDGDLTLYDISGAANSTRVQNVTEGFTDFEEGFSDYPTLIYDGPFSDHILERSPLMLKGKSEITQDQALQKAYTVSGEDNLSVTGEEGGKMPSYVFENRNTTVSVTKQGGFFSYMLKYRPVENPQLGASDALKRAEKYLEMLGIDEVEETYYEINNGICIYNFAGEQNDVVLYTDLIKVGVALDNGEIMSFDARGYITNHTVRDLGRPALSEEEAEGRLSKGLTVFETNLCVIPTDGLNERYCYEFYCVDSEGRQLLIYLNADTGEEEQILLLKIGSNGRLTV